VRVSYFSPLPPDRSGIADYSALLLPALERRVEVVVARPGRTRPVPGTDVALYHVGNNPEAHGWIVDALRRRPGVVVLHDFVVHHLMAGLTIGRKDGHAYLAAMEREAGVPGRLLGYGVLEGRVPPLWEVRPEEFPLAGEILDRATALVVHSRYVEARAREAGYDGSLWVIPHPAWPVPSVRPAAVDGDPLFGCFGFLNESKRIPQLLEAFARVRAERPGARLLLVGASSPGFDLDGRIARLGLGRTGVVREDYVEEQRLWELMAACDAVVALRAPTMGETSGTAVRALSLGKPLVVSDVGWFAELPDEVALKVTPGGDDETDELAGALLRLADDEHLRDGMSLAAREYAVRQHDLDAVADRYTAAIEYAAGSDGVEAQVLREIADAAADTGVDAELLAPQLRDAAVVRNGHGRPSRDQGSDPRTRPSRTWLDWTRWIPAGVWLFGIVAVSWAVQFLLARRVVAPWIMVDELVYSDMARSFAATGHFLIRGVHANYGVVYPAILAIPYRIFGSIFDVYSAAKAIDSLLISLAALPAYLLARRVLRPSTALVAAALAVALPSLAYAGMLMTENAFYPLFLLLVLALVRMLERPTALRQLVVLVLCGVAFLTRTQAVALVPAVLVAPLLLAWIERGRARRFSSFVPLYGLTALAALAVVTSELVRGRSPAAALGNYSQTSGGHYQAWPAFKWLLFHVGELDLALFAVPFAAAIVLVASARHLDRAVRVYVAAATSVTLLLVVEVAVFASHYSQRVEERNLFYVMPLFLIALLVWIERGQPRPPRATVAAAGLAAALPGVVPFASLIGGINVSSESDTFGLQPWWYLQNRAVGGSSVALVAVLVCAGLAGAFLFLPRRLAPWLPALVAAGFLLTWLPLELWYFGVPNASVGALRQGISAQVHRDWIDRAVPRHAEVAAIWSSDNGRPFAIQENEFWNRSVTRVYDLGTPLAGGMPSTPLKLDAATGNLLVGGKPFAPRYVLVPNSVHVAGSVVRADGDRGMLLLRIHGPLRLTTRILGMNPGTDRWSTDHVSWIRSDCRGGTLTVQLRTDTTTFPKGQTVTITGTTPSQIVRLRVGGVEKAVTVPLRSVGGVCRADFRVSPAVVPARVPRLHSTDTRLLGAHFDSFSFSSG